MQKLNYLCVILFDGPHNVGRDIAGLWCPFLNCTKFGALDHSVISCLTRRGPGHALVKTKASFYQITESLDKEVLQNTIATEGNRHFNLICICFIDFENLGLCLVLQFYLFIPCCGNYIFFVLK